MPSYLLLRDQVESGPFSFDELKEAGLNSTDLIWVEGQSTEWKYADEIKKMRDIVRYASAIRNDHPEIVDPPQADIPPIDAPQIDTGKIHPENNFVN
ncbi:MAG TPA: GYF domain-containing protein [Chitinophagaceae bacterium]|nr:GYF domain-containing protein [Chitinophagaceae bacterium]